MSFDFTPHLLPLLAVTGLSLALLFPAWRNRKDSVARWFAATLVALIVWSIGYAFEIAAVDLEDKILFANLQYLGVTAIVVCWWELARRYVGLHQMPKTLTAVLWALPALTVVVAFVNPGGLFRGAPHIDATGPFPLLHADYGPWYWWAVVPLMTLVSLATVVLLTQAVIRADRFYRRQYTVLLVALLLPLLGNFLYILQLMPWPDYNPAVSLLGISGLLVAHGLFRCQLFDMVPLARDKVIDNLADGVIVIDRQGRVVDLNRSAERLTGVERHQSVGRPAGQVFPDHPQLLDMLRPAACRLLDHTTRFDIVISSPAGDSHFAVTCSPVATTKGYRLGTAILLHDITERVRLLQQTRELADRDDLAGLPNRRHFFDLTTKELERARRHGIPLSFLVLDIDHFKQVNDNHGRLTGDDFLAKLAHVCRAALRTSDVLGRVGGEEFGILLPETRLEDAIDVAGRLREAVETLRFTPDEAEDPIMVTVSMGLTELNRAANGQAEAVNSLYERADRALYEAKRSGRNMVVAARDTQALRTAV